MIVCVFEPAQWRFVLNDGVALGYEGPLALALDQRHVLGRRLPPTRRSRRHDAEKLAVHDAQL